jgi:gluconolactonase
MAADIRGNLVVCHVGFGAAWVFSARGEPIWRIESCEKLLTTNCCFGGPDNRTLFITESATGSILRAELPEPGRPLYAHT